MIPCDIDFFTYVNRAKTNRMYYYDRKMMYFDY